MHRCLSIKINIRFLDILDIQRYSVPGFAIFAVFPILNVSFYEKRNSDSQTGGPGNIRFGLRKPSCIYSHPCVQVL